MYNTYNIYYIFCYPQVQSAFSSKTEILNILSYNDDYK